jgi:hypothetical protein
MAVPSQGGGVGEGLSGRDRLRTMRFPKRPKTADDLDRLVNIYAHQHATTRSRVRNWVSFMVLGGALNRAGYEGQGSQFTIKGGVALELRLRTVARATKDLDLMVGPGGQDLADELETALEPYEGFSFRRKGQPTYMPNGAVRVDVALAYQGRSWGTVKVDLARGGPRRWPWRWLRRYRSRRLGSRDLTLFRVWHSRTMSRRRSMP